MATQVEKMFPLLFVPSDYRKAMTEAVKVMEEAMNAGKGASGTFSAMGDAMRKAGEAATKWLTNPLMDAGAKMLQAATDAKGMGEAAGGVGEKLQQANDSINRMYASFGTLLLPMIESGAGVLSQVADSIASMDDDVKRFLLTVGGITAAMGPLSSAMGTVVKLATSPTGIVAALGLVGVAGVKMFQSMEQAALNSRLEERFGSISLSAQEMDTVIEQVLERSKAESLPLTAALDDAQTNLEKAVNDFQSQKLVVDKMMIQAEMGLDVDTDALQSEVEALQKTATEAIEAGRFTANLAVDAVFGADDTEGKVLREKFNEYYEKADGAARDKGQQLAQLIAEGLADGFLDEKEEEAINKLRQELAEITNRAASIDTKGALLRFKIEAEDMELTHDSLMSLMEQANTAVQAGVDEILQSSEVLKTCTYNLAAAENWSEDEIRKEIDAIDKQAQANVDIWKGNAYMDVWSSVGQRITGGFAEEINMLREKVPQILAEAKAKADQNAIEGGYGTGDPRYTSELRENISLGFDKADLAGVINQDVQNEAQTMYAYLENMHMEMLALANTMGTELPEEFYEALSQLDMLQLIQSMPGEQFGNLFANMMVDGLDDAQIMGALEAMMADPDGKTVSAISATMQGVQGEVASTTNAIAQEGNNAVQGYANSLSAGQGIAAEAAATLVRAALRSVQATQASHSPSREFAKLGTYGVQGYAGAIRSGTEEARRSGVSLAQAAMEGIAEGQDSHSPSKATAKLGAWSVQGYNNALKQGTQLVRATSAQLAKASVEAMDESSKKGDSSRAARRRAREEAAAAEAARQQAILAGINETAQATLAADNAAFDSRMAQLARQTQTLMDFAGAHAIWYQENKGDTQVQEVKERYDALIDQEKKRYEAQVAGLMDDAQKKAAKEAYEERTALLKKQRDEETAALKEQYSLQREMAADWLNSQKSLLQEAMDAKRAAYQEEDYQDELSDLQKRQRQSKSAREKRELQEQIDRMIRDHALEQEEAAMQETLTGYDALIEAVQAGLIGLGDLTGNAAMGDLAFGTAGLTALDNITSAQMEAALRSLSRDSLAGGTVATVSAAQMAAALASAGQKSSVPAQGEKSGNTYNINLSGAVVRDDSDITRIVEELERRIREAGR